MKLSDQQIVAAVERIRIEDFGNCTREMHYRAQLALNDAKNGNLTTAVNLLAAVVIKIVSEVD